MEKKTQIQINYDSFLDMVFQDKKTMNKLSKEYGVQFMLALRASEPINLLCFGDDVVPVYELGIKDKMIFDKDGTKVASIINEDEILSALIAEAFSTPTFCFPVARS
jgi:hypothetical protein